MKLSSVVPWERSFIEYKQMFSLSDDDIRKTILGCGDGPASFNAELTSMGGKVISVDPIYRFDTHKIRSRIEEVYPQIMEQVRNNKADFVWTNIPTIEKLGEIRMKSMNAFLSDYERGRESGRYINASLPELPFDESQFDLALCSHYLFLYSDLVSQEHHVHSMRELCRVAKEVRVYPLLSIVDNEVSPHLKPVMSDLTRCGIDVSLVPVEYEFQKGATKMLVAKYK
ncbi:MAG: SAM-dependent methyltransferase [Gammaproteobacteria bacterium]|nr:SAM-dependent methyltransferase [Gammaproteobacteria bacterium]